MISSTQSGMVQVLTLDRHEQRNALNVEIIDGLMAGMDEAQANGSRCIVITGAGTSFCSGADLDLVTEDAFRARMYAMLHRLSEIPLPVIAAVNGPAIGAGTQLAIACDLRVADPSARFMVPTAKLGFAVDAWSVRRLVSIAGGGVARALLLGLDSVSAERAHATGMADRIGGLDDALDWAHAITALAPLALQYAKLAISTVTELSTDDDAANLALARAFASEDAKEALAARAQKRAPVFRGC